jgi:hypothetical protein
MTQSLPLIICRAPKIHFDARPAQTTIIGRVLVQHRRARAKLHHCDGSCQLVDALIGHC